MSGYVPNSPKGYSYSGGEPVDTNVQRWAEYKNLTPEPEDKPYTMGCVFAKICNLPDGVINHKNPAGFVPVEKLAEYGLWAVLGTGAAITVQGTPLQCIASQPPKAGPSVHDKIQYRAVWYRYACLAAMDATGCLAAQQRSRPKTILS